MKKITVTVYVENEVNDLEVATKLDVALMESKGVNDWHINNEAGETYTWNEGRSDANGAWE